MKPGQLLRLDAALCAEFGCTAGSCGVGGATRGKRSKDLKICPSCHFQQNLLCTASAQATLLSQRRLQQRQSVQSRPPESPIMCSAWTCSAKLMIECVRCALSNDKTCPTLTFHTESIRILVRKQVGSTVNKMPSCASSFAREALSPRSAMIILFSSARYLYYRAS